MEKLLLRRAGLDFVLALEPSPLQGNGAHYRCRVPEVKCMVGVWTHPPKVFSRTEECYTQIIRSSGNLRETFPQIKILMQQYVK